MTSVMSDEEFAELSRQVEHEEQNLNARNREVAAAKAKLDNLLRQEENVRRALTTLRLKRTHQRILRNEDEELLASRAREVARVARVEWEDEQIRGCRP